MVVPKITEDIKNKSNIVEMDKPTIVKKPLLEAGIPYTQMLDERKAGKAVRRATFLYNLTLLALAINFVALSISLYYIRSFHIDLSDLNKIWRYQHEEKIICSMSLPISQYKIMFDGRMQFTGLNECPYVEEGNATLVEYDESDAQETFPIYFNVTQSGIYMIQFTARILSDTDTTDYEVDLQKVMIGDEVDIRLAAFSFRKDAGQTHEVILKLSRGDVFYFHMVTAKVIVVRPRLAMLKLFNSYE